MKTDAEKISHHEGELCREFDRAYKALVKRGFFKSEPPPKKWRGFAKRRRGK
mgnify:CR=1 FL=1